MLTSAHAVAAALIAAACALSACGGAGAANDSSRAVEVNEATGTIVLPADRFWYTQSEQEDVMSASRVALILCKRAKGIDSIDEMRKVIPDEVDDRRFGLWVLTQAEEYGYVAPASPAKQAAIAENSDPDTPQPSDAEIVAAKECAQSDPTVKHLNQGPQGGPWYRPLSEAEEKAKSSSEWADAVQEWQQCLTGRGIASDPDTLFPTGVDWAAVQQFTVQERDVELAVADVTCKRQANLVKRLAAITAAAQASVVNEYEDEFVAQRKDIEQLVTYARGVLRDAGL